MTGRKLSLLLLLTLTLSISSKDERHLLVRGGGSEEVIPVCEAETPIVFVVCRIRTDKEEQGDECRLFYQHNRSFESNCSSRFTLQAQNQTAFLHLSSLTPEDSGNYTCECSLAAGIHSLYLNITVIDDGVDENSTQPPVIGLLVIVCLCIILITVFLLFVHRNTQQRRRREPRSYHFITETQTPEPYITFMQRENEIYST